MKYSIDIGIITFKKIARKKRVRRHLRILKQGEKGAKRKERQNISNIESYRHLNLNSKGDSDYLGLKDSTSSYCKFEFCLDVYNGKTLLGVVNKLLFS